MNRVRAVSMCAGLCAAWTASGAAAAGLQPVDELRVRTLAQIPVDVMEALRSLCNHCAFADIGAPWDATDVLHGLPRRRIVSAVFRNSTWTIIYEHGGFATVSRTAVFALLPSVHLTDGSSCLPTASSPCSW